MITQNVNKTDDISSIQNGTFIYCKELRKGFVKTDLTPLSLSNTTFEFVVGVIEAMGFGLVSTDYDSVLFGENLTPEQGMILKSEKLQSIVEDNTKSMYATQIEFFVNDLKNKRRYFEFDVNLVRAGQDITISGNDVPNGYTVTVYGAGKELGSQIVGEDGLYSIILKGLTIGLWELSIVITKPDGEIYSENTLNVEVYSESVANDIENNIFTPISSSPLVGSAEPGERVDLYNNGNLVGTGIADSDGLFSIQPVGLIDTNIEIVINDDVQEITKIPTFTIPEIGSTFDDSNAEVIPVSEVNTDSIPFISGVCTEPYSRVVVTINGIVVGRTVANGTNWEVILNNLEALGIDLATVTDIKITITPPGPKIDLMKFEHVTTYNPSYIGAALGHIWIHPDSIWGVAQYDYPTHNTFVFIDIGDDIRIAYSDFYDNPGTSSTSYGVNTYYINGENILENENPKARWLELVGHLYEPNPTYPFVYILKDEVQNSTNFRVWKFREDARTYERTGYETFNIQDVF